MEQKLLNELQAGDSFEGFVAAKTASFGPRLDDCKKFIEEYFNIEIDE